MARFLKQCFAQTCLKGMDNGKLQQSNYSRSLILTNPGTIERGKIHSIHAMKENTQTWGAAYKHNNCTIMNYFLELIVCQELARQDNWPHFKESLCTTRKRSINPLCLPDSILFGSCTGTTTLSTNHCQHCHG